MTCWEEVTIAMTTGAVRVASNDMRGDRILLVEGASERAYLSALDRRIGELSARRRAFFSCAHELAHHMVVFDGLDEASNAGMASALNAINLVRGLINPTDAGWITVPTGDVASPFVVATPKYRGDAVPRLPSWATRGAAGMLSESWPDSSGTEADNRTNTRPQITFRLSDAIGPRLADVRAAILRLIDALIAMARLCEMEIRIVRRERSHVHARILARVIGRLPDIRAFVLVIIAVSRRYGRRGESDDHALPTHRWTSVIRGESALSC
jgi:hypothetical protein